jgi:hypothetical protein
VSGVLLSPLLLHCCCWKPAVLKIQLLLLVAVLAVSTAAAAAAVVVVVVGSSARKRIQTHSDWTAEQNDDIGTDSYSRPPYVVFITTAITQIRFRRINSIISCSI